MMRPLTIAGAALLPCALSIPCLPAQTPGGARVLKILPIADLLAASPGVRPPRLGMLTRVKTDMEWVARLRQGDFRLLSSDRLLNVIRHAMGPAGEVLSIRVANDSILATLDSKDLPQLAGVVEGLRHALTRRIAVSARLYRAARDVEYPAHADASRLAELTRGLELVWTGQREVLSGQPFALSQEDFIHYLASTGIEVAEEAQIADPESAAMFTGIRLVMEAHALIDTTDKVVKCQFALGEEDREIEWLSTGGAGHPSIGIPHLRSTSGYFAGRVVHQGALLVSLKSAAGAGSNLLLVLQVGDAAGQATPRAIAGKLSALPISGLAGASLTHGLPQPGGDSDERESSHGGYPAFEDADEIEDLGDMLVGLVRESLGELAEQDGTSLDVVSDGLGSGYLFVWGKPAVHEGARKVLGSLQDQWLQTVEVRSRTTLHDAPPTGGTFGPAPDPKDGAAIQHDVCFPGLLGHTSTVFKGLESAVIRDLDVEIAKKASMTRPVMQTTFSGLVTSFRPARVGQGFGGDLLVDLQYLAPVRRQPTGQEKSGDLYHVRAHRARFRRSGALQAGEVVPLGWGPRLRGAAEGPRMHQSARFRPY